ncbi:MAG: hypothetical protein ACI8PW_000233 [Methylophilaceae bacterium]|jgi:hypothetical protein
MSGLAFCMRKSGAGLASCITAFFMARLTVELCTLNLSAISVIALNSIKVDISASLNMKIIGGVEPDEKTHILITAYNVGDRPTTITNLVVMHFGS